MLISDFQKKLSCRYVNVGYFHFHFHSSIIYPFIFIISSASFSSNSLVSETPTVIFSSKLFSTSFDLSRLMRLSWLHQTNLCSHLQLQSSAVLCLFYDYYSIPCFLRHCKKFLVQFLLIQYFWCTLVSWYIIWDLRKFWV